jgi:type II secretory pathway component GspD/PulD (secretin)
MVFIFGVLIVCCLPCQSLADNMSFDMGTNSSTAVKSSPVSIETLIPSASNSIVTNQSLPDQGQKEPKTFGNNSGTDSIITSVTIGDLESGSKISIQGENLSSPGSKKISNNKILLIFKNTKLNIPKKIIGTASFVTDIRSSAHKTAAWIVIDDSGEVDYSVEASGSGFLVMIKAKASQILNTSATGVTSSEVTNDAVASANNDQESEEKTGDNKMFSRLIDASIRPLDKSMKFVLTLDGSVKYSIRKLSTPEKLVIRLFDTRLDVPVNEQNSKADADLLEKSGFVSMDLRQIGQHFSPISEAIMTIEPGTVYQVDRNLNQIVITLTAPPVVEKEEQKTGNLDQLISLELEGADMTAVLKTLGDEAGFDVDLSSGPVTGLVNEKFKNMPLKNVLAILLAPGNYAYEVQGNTLRIGTQATLSSTKKILPQVTEIIQPAGGMLPAQLDTLVRSILNPINASTSTVDPVRNVLIVHGTVSDIEEYKQAMRDLKLDSGEDTNRITRVVKLNYADPAQMITILTPYLTPLGKVQEDPRTDDLVIWEIPANMGVLLELVKEIDVKEPQVLIEANLVEVSNEKDLNIGINWGVNKAQGDTISSSANLLPTNLNFATPPSFTFGTVKDDMSISAEIEALETKKEGKIISRPRIATASGVAAEIDSVDTVIVQTVQNVLVPGGTSQQTITYSTVPLPINLKVTPRIAEDGKITTQMAVTVTSISGVALPTQPPPTTTEDATTTVTTKNGETIVIGGLVRDVLQNEVDGVPLLSDLPIIGTLFQTKSISHQKAELVIFITPTLIED